MPAAAITPCAVDELNATFERSEPRELLQWAVETFGDQIALFSAFGPEGMVLFHILSQFKPLVRVFTLDTGRLPRETHELMQTIQDLYGFQIDVYAPDPADIRKMVKAHGIDLFYRSVALRELCCEMRKVRPMHQALEGLSAWITGLRRAQTATRSAAKKIEIDELHNNMVKFNPLVDWSERQVWDYIVHHSLPYNALHNCGYRSIGCAPCTRATNPGEDIRAGRWWWEQDTKKECGLHDRLSNVRKVSNA
jgi:phosphoadenosine phosphosulfate reductase